MSTKIFCLLVVGALSALSGLAFGASLKLASLIRELPVRDSLHVNEIFQTPALSPDGRWLAYSVQDPSLSVDDTVGYGLVAPEVFVTVVELKTGRQIELGEKDTLNIYPLWSPDGRWLAYMSNRDREMRLWVWDSTTGTDRRLSEAPLFPLGQSDNGRDIEWTPDSKRIVARLAPQGVSASKYYKDVETEKIEKTIDIFVSRAWVSGETNSPKRNLEREKKFSPLIDIGVIDVANGATRLLAQGVFTNITMAISPDGNELAYVDMDRVAAGASLAWGGLFYSLKVVPLDGGSSRTIVNHNVAMNGTQEPRWSPDGTQIVYPTTDNQVLKIEGAYLASTQDGAQARLLRSGVFGDAQWSSAGDSVLLVGDPNPKPVAEGATQDLSRVTPGLWQLSLKTGDLRELTPRGWNYRVQRLLPSPSRNTYASPDKGRSAIFIARNLETPGDSFWKINTETGKLLRLQEEAKRYSLDSAAASRDGNTILYVAQDVRTAKDIWMTASSFRKSPRRVTALNPQLDRYTFGEGRVIRYRSNGTGEKLLGALILPVGYAVGQRYPLITMIYPGDSSGVTAPGELLTFLNLGTAHPNPQLFASRGYAVLYPAAPLRFGTPMRDMADAILPAIDKAIEIGVADPDSLGLYGHSYGAYSTYAMMVQSPRFKAAVASAGKASMVSAWFSLQPGTDWSYGQRWSTGQGKIAGSFWQHREQYFENSPLFYLDRVQAPLLILHGAQDATVPLWHADEVFAGLKSLGKEVEYRRYYDDGHGFIKEKNVVDALDATLRWFERYLKGYATRPN